MGNKKNIIVGAASVYLGPSGTVKPAFMSTTPYRTTLSPATGPKADGSTYSATATGALVTDWRDVGYTQNGLEVTTSPTYDDVQVDQLLDAAKIFKSAMTVTIATTFAEATLENLMVAWGQVSANSLSSVGPFENEAALEGGALGDAPNERGLIAIGNAVEEAAGNKYGERVYHAFRVLQVEASTITNSRSEATGVPVSFRALADDTTGRYGLVRDRLNV